MIIKKLNIETNRSCNLSKCRYCYTASIEGPPIGLKIEEYKKLIDKVLNKEGKLENIAITGGEPLQRNDLFEIVKYSLDKGIDTIIVTNGTLIDKVTSNIESIIKKTNNKLIFKVSLESSDKRVHEFFRGKNTFNDTLNGIKELLKIENKGNLEVFLRYILSKKFYEEGNQINEKNFFEEIKNYVSFAQKLNIQGIQVRPLFLIGKGKELKDYMLHPEEFVKAQKTFIYEVSKYKDLILNLTWPCFFDIQSVPPNVNIKKCDCLENEIAIDYKGNVVDCVYHLGQPQHYLGNILENNIFEIVNSEKVKGRLKEMYPFRKQGRCYALDNSYTNNEINPNECTTLMREAIGKNES